MCKSEEKAMTSLGHDPLCTWRQAEEADAGDPRRWLAGGLAVCDCDLITKVREDERNARTTAWDDGMEVGTFSAIEACIEAVEGMAYPTTGEVLEALRALQEKR
jgi:hypothetical protein